MQGPSVFLYFCQESNLNLGSSILGDFHIRWHILPLQNTEGHLEVRGAGGPLRSTDQLNLIYASLVRFLLKSFDICKENWSVHNNFLH